MDPHVFEDHVRAIARMLWTRAPYGGAEMIGDRERDGIFDTDDVIHFLEATTSRQKAKIENDVDKIAELIRVHRKSTSNKLLKGWLVTLYEPTADQRTAVKDIVARTRCSIEILSHETFRSKLVNAREYLSARSKYPFGSMRDPDTGDPHDTTVYVKLGMFDIHEEREVSVDDLIASALDPSCAPASGRTISLLLGDYGAGKSKTLHHIYTCVADAHSKSQLLSFPIFLNLSDHHGQTDPTEALHRHSKRIGFGAPDQLVRAWRAGHVVLFLDGFDELAPSGWQGRLQRLSVQRQRAMQLVRSFIEYTPSTSHIFLSGRVHFFDNNNELRTALGIPASASFLSLNEFTEEQVRSYLASCGWQYDIPDWLPSRPLLLGYLASRGFLDCAAESNDVFSEAEGWDWLVSQICEREARIGGPDLTGPLVRSILERIATKARKSFSGRGPISQSEMSAVFREVCGYEPDESGLQLLQRLPGLGVARQSDDAREFIDDDLVDTVRAGDVVRFCENPYGDKEWLTDDWNRGSGRLGTRVAAIQSGSLGGSEFSVACQRAVDKYECPALASEIVSVMAERGLPFNQMQVVIRDVLIDECEFDASTKGLSNVEFREAIIGRIVMDPAAREQELPRFRECHIEVFEAIDSLLDAPNGRFVNCDVVTALSPSETNNKIMASSLPDGTKVLLTVLKKLFVQAGRGRRQNAFSRGLDQHAQLLVPDILQIIAKHGIATRSKVGGVDVWLPNRSVTDRVRKILANPGTSIDALVRESQDVK